MHVSSLVGFEAEKLLKELNERESECQLCLVIWYIWWKRDLIRHHIITVCLINMLRRKQARPEQHWETLDACSCGDLFSTQPPHFRTRQLPRFSNCLPKQPLSRCWCLMLQTPWLWNGTQAFPGMHQRDSRLGKRENSRTRTLGIAPFSYLT